MTRKLAYLAALVVTVFAIEGFLQSALAMPGFARRTRQSCTTCHYHFPKLKPYGDDYAGRGFQLEEGDPSFADLDLGDDLLLLPREIPLGMRGDVFGTYDPDEDPQGDFKMPFNLKLISGAPLHEHISYYMYFFFSERSEVAGIEDAFLFFDDIGGFNFTFGQFAIADPIIKGELRLTFEGYEALGRSVGSSTSNLKYDRGIIVDYGFDFGLGFLVQVVNGNGIGESFGDSHAFDRDDYKNPFARVSQSIGPVDIGGFYYQGWETNDDPENPVLNEDEIVNTFYYAGGDLTLTTDYVTAALVGFARNDDNPDYLDTEPDESIDSLGGVGEISVFPAGPEGRWALTLLYNHFTSDYEMNDVNVLDYQSGTGNLSFLIARNVRLLAEYNYIFKDYSRTEPDPEDNDEFENHHRITLGLIAGM